MHISATDLRGQLARARAEFPFIDAVEDEHGLPDYLLYAVGSRETNLRNIAGDFGQRPGVSGPRFHGFGIWQRDSGSFGVGEAYLDDVVAQADDAAGLLASHFARFQRWDAAVAAYNAGAGAVAKALRKGKSCDSVTTGRDYSADVLARRAFLERDRNGAGVHELVGLDGAVYLVRSGDTLTAIASRFHTTVAALVAANDLPDPDVLVVGQVLDLPGTSPGHAAAQPARTHVVAAGETLTRVAREFDTTVERLVALNRIADPDRIFVGQVLLVA
jgi:LysM repeat protein